MIGEETPYSEKCENRFRIDVLDQLMAYRRKKMIGYV